MSAVLHIQPNRSDINGSKTSKWSAVHHPIIYQFQRKDFIVNQVVNSGGFIKIVCQTGAVLGLHHKVYLKCGPYDGVYSITASAGSSAILDGAFISTASSGFINNITARPAYRMSVKIYTVNTSNAYQQVGNGRYYPDVKGLIRVDVSAFMRRKAALLNTCHYSAVNEVEPTMGGSFNITYREDWTGSANTWTTLSNALKNYWVNAARQLRDKYGSNLGAFVPFFDNDPVKARFLHLQGKPVYFSGFPFCIDFIYSDHITGIHVTREVQFRDVNGGLLSSLSTALNTAQVETLHVNHLMLPALPPGCTRVDVWLQGDSTIQPGNNYSNTGYVLVGYTQSRGNSLTPSNPVE